MDLSMDGKAGKVEKVLEMDPSTGQPKEKKKTAGEPKTLSKKDKKNKKSKKDNKSKKEKKVNKKEDKKKAAASPEMMHVDINDPDALNRVLAQIQQTAKDHSSEFYRKQEEEETKKEEEMEKKDKDEL